MLKSNEISFNDYKKRILEMHQFIPKKKYVEELADTGSSDPPSMSYDSDSSDEESDQFQDETLV